MDWYDCACSFRHPWPPGERECPNHGLTRQQVLHIGELLERQRDVKHRVVKLAVVKHAAVKQEPDRKAYMREYMREYMRKHRGDTA
jgi:hypothetical protein